jgi:hypothetical protein
VPRLSGILVAGIPVEDPARYAYSAMLFGTYYKYATGEHLVGLGHTRPGEGREPPGVSAADGPGR